LAQHFVGRLARQSGRQMSLARSALELLLRYSFPGNVKGNRTKAASLLGISRDTLYRKLRQAKAEG
jgi:DNA-binding NtrC family response regulator